MFDFFLSINTSNQTFEPYINKYFFERDDVDEIKSSGSWYKLEGLSHDKNKSIYESSNEIIFVVGNIYLREGYPSKHDTKNILIEISKDYQNRTGIYKKYKGNFCIVILNKISRVLTLYNSQLGINHIYYFSTSNMLYVSNNLNHFKYLNLRYNSNAFYQKILFSYVLSDDTFISGVKRLNPGSVLQFNNNSLTVNNEYNINALFENLGNDKFSVEKYIYLFNKSVKEKSEYINNINVSFTGGFDGRTIISSLLNQNIDFNSYSFGKYNGENTRVPMAISKKIGVKYEPIYLEDEYEKNYVDNAKQVIYFSDGMSFNERANYIYAFRKLSKKSNYVLSGLVGGETLRPVHLRTDYINENYYQIIYLNNSGLIDKLFKELNDKKYIRKCDSEIIGNIKDLISDRRKYIQIFRNMNNGYLFYLADLMSLGFRMYYGTEIHYERQFANNLTPFYDIDILEYILSTDYINVFKNAFKNSKMLRWSGQKIYAQVIQRNYKDLNRYPVDRGYPPVYLLNLLKLPAVPVLYYIRKKRRNNHIDFDESKWSKLFLNNFLNENNEDKTIFAGEELKKEINFLFNNGLHSSDFNKIISLQTWVNL